MTRHPVQHLLEDTVPTRILGADGVNAVRVITAPYAGTEPESRPGERAELLDRLRDSGRDLIAARQPQRLVSTEWRPVPPESVAPQPAALLILIPLGDVG